MPLWDYRCDNCGETIECLVTKAVCDEAAGFPRRATVEMVGGIAQLVRYDGEPDECPACRSPRMRRRIGRFCFKM